MKIPHLGSLFYILSLLISSCTTPDIQGNIKPSDEYRPVVYVTKPKNFDAIAASYMGEVIDSAHLDTHGNFEFTSVPNKLDQSLLFLSTIKKDEKYLNKLVQEPIEEINYIPIWYQINNPVSIEANQDKLFQSAHFQNPSEVQQELMDLSKLKIKSTNDHLTQLPELDEQTLMLHEEKQLAYQNDLLQFAMDSKHWLSALLAVRWASPEGDYERIADPISKLAKKLQDQAFSSPFTEAFLTVVDPSKLPILIGDNFPNEALPMLNGDTVLLHQFLGDSLTILDLWASWCAPCRKENKEVLLPLYRAYHQKGLSIIGYGLESGQSVWQKAIQKDGADVWHHASHLQGDESPFFETLRISTIPANYILDGQGKVLAKNIHGEALQEWVRAYFEK